MADALKNFGQGAFPFTRTFNALEVRDGANVSLQLMQQVLNGYPQLDHWSQVFDASEENFDASVAAGRDFHKYGVRVVPVGFTVHDVNPVERPDAFVDFMKSQVRLCVALRTPNFMLLPEAWRYNVGKAPFDGAKRTDFVNQTAASIVNGLADAPDGFRMTIEMLSPHESRNFNSIPRIVALLRTIRKQLQQAGRKIEVGLTLDTAHVFYPRVAERPRMDVAFAGRAVPFETLLAQFADAVKQGFVFQLHDSLEFSRSHGLKPSIDGQKIPRQEFLSTAFNNGFNGLLTVETMNPKDPIIVGSGLEGMPDEANWEDPAEPLISVLQAERQIIVAL